MKKIIIPVDFSDTSASALRFGTYLAEVMGLDLEVVHVFDANFSLAQAVSTGALLAEKERLKKLLSTFVERHAFPILATFQGNLATIPAIHTEVLEGFPGSTLRSISKREDAELIIMGGVGAGQADTPTRLFGGAASTVALSGECPVILIPAGYGYPEVKSLAVAFGEAEDIRKMGGIVHRLIKVLRPQVNFVHVEGQDRKKESVNDEAFLEMAMGPGFPSYTFHHHVLPHGTVAKRLLQYAEEKKIGMLVLGGKRRSFWEGLFAASSLKPVVNSCTVPLLVIPLDSPEQLHPKQQS